MLHFEINVNWPIKADFFMALYIYRLHENFHFSDPYLPKLYCRTKKYIHILLARVFWIEFTKARCCCYSKYAVCHAT